MEPCLVVLRLDMGRAYFMARGRRHRNSSTQLRRGKINLLHLGDAIYMPLSMINIGWHDR